MGVVAGVVMGLGDQLREWEWEGGKLRGDERDTAGRAAWGRRGVGPRRVGRRGAQALRNDDIIRCLSGKSCEINNTDAEGRLVLADGVAHATAHPPRLAGLQRPPDLVVDMATLTGAQMVSRLASEYVPRNRSKGTI